MKIKIKCYSCLFTLFIDSKSTHIVCEKCGKRIEREAGIIRTGTVLSDFTLLKLVEDGSSVLTFMAHQISLDRTVYIEIFIMHENNSFNDAVDFYKKFIILTEITSSNLPFFISANMEYGYNFIVYKFFCGKSISQCLDKTETLEPNLARTITLELIVLFVKILREKHLLTHFDVSHIYLIESNEIKISHRSVSLKHVKGKKSIINAFKKTCELYYMMRNLSIDEHQRYIDLSFNKVKRYIFSKNIELHNSLFDDFFNLLAHHEC